MQPPTTTWDSPPRITTPPEGAVHVYRATLAPKRSTPWADTLSAEEQARAARFVFAADRARFTQARAGLRHLLGACLNLSPANVPIRNTESGKPYVKAASPALMFNVAHTQDLVLYALTSGLRVGVDVEMLRPLREFEDIAARFFSSRERAALAAAPGADRWAVFLRFWTRKEAMVKATGEGIWDAFAAVDTADPPLDAERWTRCDLDPGADHAAALVVEGAGVAIRCFDWAIG